MNPPKTNQPDTVAVFGLGYVGCVSAACLASLGHRVTGVDRDLLKIDAVNAGRAPFFEPGLEPLIQSAAAAGRLRATGSAAEALAGAGIALICVGTPSESNGNLGLDQLRRVFQQIGEVLKCRPQPLVIAIRSTVFPGTCEEMRALLGETDGAGRGCRAPAVSVVSNPEFLREGAAVRDFFQPALLVVGGEPRDAVARVAALYDSLPAEPCIVSLRTAEMIKYACNAFHAVKVSFANEVGVLSESLGVNGHEVMETLCRDEKLNISAAYLKPGFAFGGSCLPKDLRALVYRAGRLDLRLPMLEHVLPSNDEHLRRAIQKVLGLDGRLAVYGLAFKDNTDDLRESPIVPLLETLIGKGREVRVFDPHVRLERIYGSNRNFLLSSIPHIERLLCGSLQELLAGASHVVIAQKPAPDSLEGICACGLPVVSLIGEL